MPAADAVQMLARIHSRNQTAAFVGVPSTFADGSDEHVHDVPKAIYLSFFDVSTGSFSNCGRSGKYRWICSTLASGLPNFANTS